MKTIVWITVFLCCFSNQIFSQITDKIQEDTLQENQLTVKYKQVDTVDLYLYIYYPPNYNKKKKYPAIVFYFGGGWKWGSYKQFEPHAKYFADRGMIGILVDYRVKNKHKTTPFDAVKDAKSSIRFLRENAKELNINKRKIVAAGGSAGGHLAAAAGNIIGLEEEVEDLSISSRPDALVLFNPVFDNGPEGYGYDRIGERYKEISPIHNIRKGAPPTIVFLGTADKLIPVKTAFTYKNKMEDVGSRCDLFLYKEQKHGFFKFEEEFYKRTLYEADMFLVSLGYLKGEPTFTIGNQTD